MVTLKDVAHKAGVSASTVSLVMNGRDAGRISPALSAVVRQAAEELGYTPNRMAVGLRTQRSRVIGFVSDEIVTTPFAGQVVLGAQQAARARGLQLMIVNDESEIAALHQYQAEGIIYAHMYHQKVEILSTFSRIPTVLVDAFSDDQNLPTVVPDEERISIVGVGHLIARGHRRIGFITNVHDIPATRGRLAGYRRALEEAGITCDSAIVTATHSTTNDARTAALEMLSSPERPTALYCFNDQMAMGAYQAAARLGLRIPEDLSVVGVDNLEIIAAQLDPGLSTVALPHYEMGQWAIEYLWARIQGSPLPPGGPFVKLDCPLIERDSVTPPL